MLAIYDFFFFIKNCKSNRVGFNAFLRKCILLLNHCFHCCEKNTTGYVAKNKIHYLNSDILIRLEHFPEIAKVNVTFLSIVQSCNKILFHANTVRIFCKFISLNYTSCLQRKFLC